LLFALVDWVKYVCKVGRYSPGAMARMGAIYASPEGYSAFVASVAPGYFLFVHPTRSTVSWAVMYLTHGPWSHIGTLATPDTVFEAVTGGVGEYPLKRYFDGRHYLSLLRLPLNTEQLAQIRSFAKETSGKDYAYHQIARLFLLTICNEHADYRVRFTVDLFIVLGLVAFLVPLQAVKAFVVLLGLLYLIILGASSFLRLRAALRLHRDYLELVSPMSHEPFNASPNRLYRLLLRHPCVQIAEPFGGRDTSSAPPARSETGSRKVL